MTTHEIVRAGGELGVRFVRYALTAILFSLALLPFILVRDWIKRRFWPPREDPERRAQAKAWTTLMAEAEEHTREPRARDPHVLTLTETPHDADAPASADTRIRNS
ncbi:MAG TPA: hypothetical protein VFI53_18010 [Myxococcaceae bacterium]|nr:hypothetical protein [Myxococcaceae bacterium]